MCLLFQSTPPVKAATFCLISSCTALPFQSTPPVKAATANLEYVGNVCSISIHAAREGGDKGQKTPKIILTISIHAAREGGDYESLVSASNYDISIHAAREGGDNGEY